MTKSVKYIALFGTSDNSLGTTKTFAASSDVKAIVKMKAYSKSLGIPCRYSCPMPKRGGVYHMSSGI